MPGKVHLDQLNLIVGDMEKSLAFYRLLGLPLGEKTSGETGHVGLFTDNGFGLDFDKPDFAKIWNPGWVGREDLAGKMVVSFRLESRKAVDERYQDLTAAGFVGLQPPYDAFWGSRYAVLEDPDGNAVGLMSPADPALRKAPPGQGDEVNNDQRGTK
ncbi:MAG TPA: VOC family protein [bacterium]|nr:VOC family protein [bacterium]